MKAADRDRFPSHAILAEESDEPSRGRCRAGILLGARSARRHDQLRARAAAVLGVARVSSATARRSTGRYTTRCVTNCSRRSEGEGAFLNGERLHVSEPTRSSTRCCAPGFPYDVHRRIRRAGRAVRGVSGQGAGGSAARLGRARPVLRRRGPLRRLLGGVAQAVGHLRGRPDRRGSRGTRDGWDGRAYQSRQPSLVATNGRLHAATCSTSSVATSGSRDSLRDAEPV